MRSQANFEVCPIYCSAIFKSVESISLHERGDLPVVLFPCKSELVSMVDNSSAIFECPTRLDFGIQIDGTIQMRSVFKDESISPVTLFLVEGSILNPVLDCEVIVCEQFVGELDTVLSGSSEVCVSIHDFNWTDFGANLCVPCSLSVSICVFPIILLDLVVVFGWFCHHQHREDECHC